MTVNNWIRSGLVAALALAGLPAATPASAADIVPYENEAFGCVVKLTGQIEAGDADKLVSVINAMATDNPAGPIVRMEGGYYKRSKLAVNFDPKRRICLDSPGGNLAEGIRLADMIYEVLGTAIEPGAQCLSACSIAFMAGSISTESDAGVIADRVMDATARLGFHAPDLTVQDGNYNGETVQAAFYVAINSTGEILKRSGEMKFPYTLVGEMLRTPPQQFFYIDTVNKAARWLIDVANTVGPKSFSPLALSNACNNWYRFHADQMATNGLGDGSSTERWGFDQAFKAKTGSFELSLEGFGQEGATKCHVNGEFTSDGALSGSIRIGEDEIGTNLAKWIVYDQSTRLEQLALSRNPSPFRDPGGEAVAAAPAGQGACLVIHAGAIADFEPCTRIAEKKTAGDLSTSEVRSFVWPSGGKTVVVDKSTSDGSGNTLTINGVRTSPAEMSGIERALCQTPSEKLGVSCTHVNAECYYNAATAKLFCYLPAKG